MTDFLESDEARNAVEFFTKGERGATVIPECATCFGTCQFAESPDRCTQYEPAIDVRDLFDGSEAS